MSRFDFFTNGSRLNKSDSKRKIILALAVVAFILQAVIEFHLWPSSATASYDSLAQNTQVAMPGNMENSVSPASTDVPSVESTPNSPHSSGAPEAPARKDDGKGQPTPGKVQGTPGKVTPTPGKMPGIPGKMQGVPGKMEGTPGKMKGTPGKGNTPNQKLMPQDILLGIKALTSPECKCQLTAAQAQQLQSALKELDQAYDSVRSSTHILHETLTPEQFQWLEKNPDNTHKDDGNVPPEQGAYESAMAALRAIDAK